MPVTSSVTLPSTFVFLQQIIKTKKKHYSSAKTAPYNLFLNTKLYVIEKIESLLFMKNQTRHIWQKCLHQFKFTVKYFSYFIYTLYLPKAKLLGEMIFILKLRIYLN